MRCTNFFIVCAMVATPAWAQTGPARVAELAQDQEGGQQQPLPPLRTGPMQPGHIATSSVGQIGQRQTGDRGPDAVPTGRIANRLQNRVQNRIQTRVDRDYEAQTSATSPFAVAEDQVRGAGRRRQ